MSIEVGKRYMLQLGTQSVTGPLVEVFPDGRVIVASEQHNSAPLLALEHEIVRELPALTAPAGEVQS